MTIEVHDPRLPGGMLQVETDDPKAAALAAQKYLAANAPKPAGPPAKTSQALGFYQGITKPLDNAAQGLESLAGRVGINTDAVNNFVGLPSAKSAAQSHANYVASQVASGTNPGTAGRVTGEIAGTLPLAAVSSNPIALGAMSGAALSDAPDNAGLARDTIVGGIGGKIGDVALNGIRRVVQPVLSPYVQQLIAAGVKLTPGQIVGGTVKRVEDAATSLPIVGDMIRGAQGNSIRSLNTVAANRALAPVGETVPASIKPGGDTVGYVADTLGQKYDTLLPKMQGNFDMPMAQDISAAGANLPASHATRLQSIIDQQIYAKGGAGGNYSGDVLNGIDQELRRNAAGYSSDPSFDNRQLGGAVGDVRSAFQDMISRNNPDYADQLTAIRRGYANYARVRQASQSLGAHDGVFTPAQLHSAVRAGDQSAGNGQFARGDAMMQDLSTAAREVLPSSVPDSGTATRSIVNGVALGAGALISPKTLIAALGVASIYSKPGLAALEVALTRRPQIAQQISSLLAKGQKPAAIAAANALMQAVPAH